MKEKFNVKKLYVHGGFSEEDIKKRGNALSQTQPPAERVQLRGTALYDSIIADFFNADNGKASFEQSAWHGFPYDFREFLLEMIGAGEMAAEKEAVRKQYDGTAQWMKAPNGEATNLTEDQWLTVRTPAFKAWFGDWEKASAAYEIHALIPVEVALSGKSLDKKTAEEAFSSFGEVENVRYGTYATFPKSMVGKIIKHKGLDVSQIIADIPHLFSSSVLTFVEPEYKREGHKEHPNILAYHPYVNKFKANGKTYYIRFSLREEKTKDQQKWNGKRILHSTGISDIEIYEDNKKDVSSQRIRVSDPGEESKTSFVDYRVADFFDSVKDCSKIVDENGEPLPSAISEVETLAQPSEEKRGGKGKYHRHARRYAPSDLSHGVGGSVDLHARDGA